MDQVFELLFGPLKEKSGGSYNGDKPAIYSFY